MTAENPTRSPFSNGDVVFFKKAKKATKRNAMEVTFKGHAFGVMLGHVPPFAKDPTPDQLLRQMGAIGFMTFDDVAEFLGDDAGAKCVKMYEDKYYGKEAQEAADQIAAPPPETSRLVDAAGVPMPKTLEVVQDESH